MILEKKVNCRIIDFRSTTEARKLALLLQQEERISRECQSDSDLLGEYQARYNSILEELE